MTSSVDVVPEIKQILGAMILGANRPLSVKEMRKCLVEVAETYGGETAAFSKARESDIEAALEELRIVLEKARAGLVLAKVGGGFKIQTDVSCGKWLKHLLDARSNRLSRPALETLAIIAYRQPLSRSEIESIRGVNVDHIISSLLEMQLIRIVGRSSLPGRPFLYGATHYFYEHFGLNDMADLGEVEPMLKMKFDAKNQDKAQEAPDQNAEAVASKEEEKEQDKQDAVGDEEKEEDEDDDDEEDEEESGDKS